MLKVRFYGHSLKGALAKRESDSIYDNDLRLHIFERHNEKCLKTLGYM